MPNKILIKKNTIAGTIPTALQLDVGELALNAADGRLFTKKVDNTVIQLTPNIITIPFSYGDASPQYIYTTQINSLIKKVSVIISTSFNGIITNLSIGDSNNDQRLLPYSSIYSDETGEYSNNPFFIYTTVNNINLYISLGGGVTQGSGYILIEVSN